ncbi:MAG: Spy/CpxP family protein refolding chaperone [Leptospirillia bacterium]
MKITRNILLGTVMAGALVATSTALAHEPHDPNLPHGMPYGTMQVPGYGGMQIPGYGTMQVPGYGGMPVPGYALMPRYRWHDRYDDRYYDGDMDTRDRRHRHHLRAARAAEWMDYMRDELAITSKQEEAWNTFSDAVMARARMPREHFKSDSTDRMVRDIERTEHRIERMKQYLERARDVKNARDNLFSALDDTQKEIARDLLSMP